MKGLCTTLVLLIACPLLVYGQSAPIPKAIETYVLDSGFYDGPSDGAEPQIMFSDVVRIDRVPWLRLHFDETYLGNNSYLLIRSLLDGGTQLLDGKSIVEWQNSSAYFNGDAVEIELYVGARDQGIFFSLAEVVVGRWAPGDDPESQCGPTDDREPSDDPAAGRLLDIGCTAWLVCDGWFVSAGHCIATASLVDCVEFNVPNSLPNGTIQHPGPEDQYAANTATRSWVNGGVGNDWGVFEVFDNSVTGLQPIDAQGAHFELVQNINTNTIRITGYGVDFNDGERNQTQQTHSGPDAGSSGTTMRYQTDTEGGNSGSPVIDDDTGESVGVHTHGGCTTGGGGNNSGTSTLNAAFWAAAEPHSLGCDGGTGASCDDVDIVQARCKPSDGTTLQARVRLFDDSHNGETMTLTVDGVDYVLTIASYGFGNGVRMQIPNVSPGSHTVELTEPAGCTGAIVFDCGEGDVAHLGDDWGFDENLVAEQPIETALLGNYPNPFNPSTTISYALANDGFVSLKVYNTLGQEVATLVNGFQAAGTFTATWNGTNDFGSAVSSGIYIYRLQTNDVVVTEKMMFMK